MPDWNETPSTAKYRPLTASPYATPEASDAVMAVRKCRTPTNSPTVLNVSASNVPKGIPRSGFGVPAVSLDTDTIRSRFHTPTDRDVIAYETAKSSRAAATLAERGTIVTSRYPGERRNAVAVVATALR
jgi:hypothetical protein